MPELFGHPFSSYTWKTLIPLYENATAFTFRMIDEQHPQNAQRLQAHSPLGKFPLLLDGDIAIFESSVIIEHLQHHYPGTVRFIPPEQAHALEVRMVDRFFDNYVMTPVQQIVDDFIRTPGERSAAIVVAAKAVLQRSYAWLDARLQDREWVCGDFSLADCAAAPSLFYADWVYPVAPDFEALRGYRARLLNRPSVRRCVDDARPYRGLFPAGAPERD